MITEPLHGELKIRELVEFSMRETMFAKILMPLVHPFSSIMVVNTIQS